MTFYRWTNGGFAYCKSLENIVIPDGVTAIVLDAFCRCTHLKSVIIPKSVTSIGSNSFYECKYLCISGYHNSYAETFANAHGISFIALDESTTKNGKCGDNAYWDLSDDGTLTISGYGGMYDYDYYEGTNVPNIPYFGAHSSTLDNAKKINNIVFSSDSNITYIGRIAFSRTGITDFNIPTSVDSIGAEAFSSCENLTEITLPKTLSSLNYGCFLNCKSLKKITVLNSELEIGERALGYEANTVGHNDATIYNDVVIYGYKNSTAETYATENGIVFIALDSTDEDTITSENGLLSYTGYMKDGNIYPNFKQYSLNVISVKINDNPTYTSDDVTWSVNSEIIEIGHTNSYDNTSQCYFIAWQEGSAVITATLPDGEKLDLPINIKDTNLNIEITAITKREFVTSAATEYYNEPIDIGFRLYMSCPMTYVSNDANYTSLYNRLIENLPIKSFDNIKFTLPDGFTFENKTNTNEFNQIVPLKVGQKVSVWAQQKVNMDIYPIIPENKKANYYKFNVDVTVGGKTYDSVGHITVSNCDYISKKTQDNSKDKVESTPKNSVGGAFESTYRSHIKGNDSASKQIRGSFSYLREAITPEAFNKVAADTLMFCDLQMMESVSSGNNQLKEIFGYEGLKASALWNINKKALLTFKDIPDQKNTKTYTVYVQFQTTGSSLMGSSAAYCVATAYIDIGNHKVVECGTYVTTYENLSSLNSDLRDIYNKNTHVGDYAYWIRLGIKDYCGITGLKKANEISDFIYTLYCNVKSPSLPKFEINSLSDITKLCKEVINPNSNTNKFLNIKCPVDVEILNSDGNIVGAIRDNKVVVSSDDVAMSVNGDEKNVKLNAIDNYSVVLSGTDSGTMEYIVNEYVDGENVRTVTFENISLSESSVYTGEVDEMIFQDENSYSLTSELGKIINPNSDSYTFGESTNIYTVEFPEKIVVQRDSDFLISDEIIQPGDVLTISASDNTVASILVNGYSLNNGSTYTVGESDVNISITINEDNTHTHSYGENWAYNKKNHWYECECGKRILEEQHTKDRGVVTVPADTETNGIRTYFCSICGAIVETEIILAISVNHYCDFNVDWSCNSSEHWQECDCGARKNIGTHSDNGGITVLEPTETSTGISVHSCTVCGYVMRTESIPAITSGHIHSFSTNWYYDDTFHWHKCYCGEKSDLANHRENEGVVTLQPTTISTGIRTYSCRDCGYVMRTETIPEIPEEHTHSFGTDWKYDSTSHWHECSCGERSDIAVHTENSGVVTVQPTTTSTGTRTYSCTVCGYATRTETIPVISTPTIPIHPDPIIPDYPYPTPGTEILPPVLTVNKNIDISVTSDLKDLAKGEARIKTKRRFFDASAEVRLTNTEKSEAAGKRALERLDDNSLICYPFDISVYNADNGSKMHLAAGGYITFEIAVPRNMEATAASIEVYHIPGGVPEHIESEIITDKYDNLKIVFTASEFSSYMFTAVAGEDIASGAGVTAGSVSVDMTSPVTNGVNIPTAKLPSVLRYSGKKRRYRILRKRRLDDLVFVY